MRSTPALPNRWPGLHHWRQATITQPSLDERGSIFFAAVEMTRMPMILADPRQSDCPIAFANNAFLDLTGYEEAEVVGRNCRFLQGAGTDPDSVRLLREAIAHEQAIALEILNYRRDGAPFWNRGCNYRATAKLWPNYSDQTA